MSMSPASRLVTMDGNEAVASIAYRCNDVIGIYPITPSSPMSETCEVWESQEKTNCWGVIPKIMEMQSEGGAAGVVHGALPVVPIQMLVFWSPAQESSSDPVAH